MNNTMQNITCMSVSAIMAILILCSIVLIKGGFFPIDYKRKKPNRIRLSFAIYLMVIAVSYVSVVVNELFWDGKNIQLENFFDSFIIASLGFFCLFAYILQQKKPRIRHWMLAFGSSVPLLVFAIGWSEEYKLTFEILAFTTYVVITTVNLYCTYLIKLWDEQLLEMYSDVAEKQTQWYRKLVMPFFIISLLWIPLGVFPDVQWITIIYRFILICTIVRFTAYALCQEEFVFVSAELYDHPSMEDKEDDWFEETTMEETDAEPEIPIWAKKLEILMTEQCIYRKEDLTSADVAAMLHVNRTYLSQYLNKVLNINFYEYVNKYRLDESEKLLKEGKMNIAEIATSCGFRDRIAFYRAFRKRHETPPTEFLKEEE